MNRVVGGFHSLFYALRIILKVGPLRLIPAMLAKNTCKTCALGMGGQKGGMTNELGRFPEVCKKSLQAMESDFQQAIPRQIFQHYKMSELGSLGPRKIEKLGRLSSPLYSSGDNKLRPISWDEAFDKISDKIKKTDPRRSFFYFSGRSSNEAGFLLQIFARVFGTNHVNNCSYYCHQASGVGLTASLGSGTATVNLEDVENSDFFMLIGANPTSNHPRLLTTLSHIKKKKGKVVVVNPVVEPGLKKFNIPSNPWSLLFGTKIADVYLQPHIGGDLALLYGMSKYLIEDEDLDFEFIKNSTVGFEEFKNKITELSWEDIVLSSGLSRLEIKGVAEIYKTSENAVLSWAMGVTHHKNGTDTVQAIVNLALLRGMVGRKNAGLLPLRGHSNVQGMGTIGVTPKLKEKIFENLEAEGLKLPTFDGYDTMACMEAADRQKMDLAFCLGGNLYASNPDLSFASKALNKIGMMVYLNTTLNEGHFYAQGKETLILPVSARDEESESTTQESMFSFVRLSDGGSKRISGTKSEVEIVATLGERCFADSPVNWSKLKNHNQIREFISKTIPGLNEMEKMGELKKEFQIPNRIHHTPQFPTADGKAHFHFAPLLNCEQGLRMMTIRSEGQFNTVVFEEEDKWRGVKRRDVILMNEGDMKRFGLEENQRVSISSKTGRLDNILVQAYDIKAGNTLMYYPEANILVSRDLDPRSKTPAYKNVQIRID